jgi:DNA-nicking Smr family endonuclease
MAHKPSDAERALFRAAMKDVRPLTKNTIAPVIKRHHKIKLQITKPDQEFFHPAISDYDKKTVSANEVISFVRLGVQPNYFRNLQKGRLPIEAELDLHSLSIDQARTELLTFLPTCALRGVRVVRIIHGKGQRGTEKKPLLKNKVNTWLQQLDEVLAFCSTIPKDGGTGAVYVLLRRK